MSESCLTGTGRSGLVVILAPCGGLCTDQAFALLEFGEGFAESGEILVQAFEQRTRVQCGTRARAVSSERVLSSPSSGKLAHLKPTFCIRRMEALKLRWARFVVTGVLR